MRELSNAFFGLAAVYQPKRNAEGAIVAGDEKKFHQYGAEAERLNYPPGTIYDSGIVVGSQPYYNLLAGIRLSHDYEKRILGAETPCQPAGPWVFPWYRRNDTYGDLWCVVNTSSGPQYVSPAAVPTTSNWVGGEVLKGGVRTILSAASVRSAGFTLPGSAVAVLVN